MDTTGAWTTRKVASADIELNEGENTITLKSTTSKGGANVDAFLFDVGGVKAVEEETSALPQTVHFNGGFFYRPATGTLFTSVPGYAEVLFYDVSGSIRGAVSGNVPSGESVLALDRGALPSGLYVVKVKLDGIVKQQGLFKY